MKLVNIILLNGEEIVGELIDSGDERFLTIMRPMRIRAQESMLLMSTISNMVSIDQPVMFSVSSMVGMFNSNETVARLYESKMPHLVNMVSMNSKVVSELENTDSTLVDLNDDSIMDENSDFTSADERGNKTLN